MADGERCKIRVTSCRVKEGWLAVAIDGRGRIFANSIPCPYRETSLSSVVRSLQERGVEDFMEDAQDHDGKGEEAARFIMGGGGRMELAFEGLSELQVSIMTAVMGIPKGTVASYGDIASALGNPRLARAVGRAMKRNPFPILVPCHRVVRSDMSLGGFSYGTGMKEVLLGREGVEVVDGTVRGKHRLARGKLSCRSSRCP